MKTKLKLEKGKLVREEISILIRKRLDDLTERMNQARCRLNEKEVMRKISEM
jgi:hypothetical protein